MKISLAGSDCGYDHHVSGSKKRHTPAAFTGCLAHAEITYAAATQKILRLRGYFQHDNECKRALLTRIPAQPLHESVFRVALAQLAEGASLGDIQKRNRTLIKTKGYPEMPSNPREWKQRWLFSRGDTRSLYRQHHRLKGVKVTEKPHINIDEWLDPKCPRYNQTFADAVFHYSARASKGERLEICVSTREMKEMAWKYGHRSQILMDGTFGVCDKKVLLFIMMAVDEDGHGVPLAFLFFSAPSGNRQTSSGYDANILTKLLAAWRQSLEDFRGGQKFYAMAAITDTDLKERIALVKVFPEIFLLICRVHLRRSWRNHRNRFLKGKSPIVSDIRRRLKAVEDALVQTLSFEAAESIIENEADVLREEIEIGDGDTGPACEAALVHLEYLSSYWLSEDLWRSWSDFGRHAAAKILGCTIEIVIPTTNHLEAFNRVIKHNHIGHQQHGGRRLRLDVLLHFMVTDMLPSIFEQRAMSAAEHGRYKEWVLALPGGDQLWKEREAGRRVLAPVAYLVPDASRDAAAQEILSHIQLSAPTPDAEGFLFTCYSTLATQHDKTPKLYSIKLAYVGIASCNCADFIQRGGACKHLRAALLSLQHLREQYKIPIIPIPTSEQDARTLVNRLTLYRADHDSHNVAPQVVVAPIARSVKVLDDLLRNELGLSDKAGPGTSTPDEGSGESEEDDEEIAKEGRGDGQSSEGCDGGQDEFDFVSHALHH